MENEDIQRNNQKQEYNYDMCQKKCFDCLETGDVSYFSELLNSLEVYIWDLHDHDGYSLITKSSFLNMTDITIFLIEEVRKKAMNIDANILSKWINHKGNNGFTALHYASFRGNIRIIEKLIENGADITIMNNNGLNVMHLAAQGDQPTSLVYFKEKHSLKINPEDKVLSTPLHWACYMGSESAVDYLVSWNADINCKDKDGFTPLHLSIMTEKTRIVRKLLKLGANTEAKDSKNRKPVDIAIQMNNQALIELLSNASNLFSCTVSQQKAEDSNLFPLLFYIYFTITEAFNYFIIVPSLENLSMFGFKDQLSIIFFSFLIITYLKLYFSDPGYRKIKNNKSLEKLVIDGEVLNNICPWCVNQMSCNTRHCYFCKKCVENHDHHCIWIKNCVGRNNYKTFMLFLILVCIKIIVNIYLSFFCKIHYKNIGYYSKNNTMRFSYNLNIIPIRKCCVCLSVITGLLIFVPVL
jgi:ankyrin repeat protein